MTQSTFVAFSFLLFFLTACSTQKPYYNYGEYEQDYYTFKKESSQTSMLQLQQSMEKAIEEKQNSIAKRVPPGMYANLGYLYLKQGKTKKAKESFLKEKQIYPEASRFMNTLIKKIEIAQEKK